MSRAEMDLLGWDVCDMIIVTGDAYVDHPSFGMAIIGRLLEAQGFRVGIIAQPDWQSAEPFKALGKPQPVLRRQRRQHGLDDQPLHGRSQDPLRRRLYAGRRGRQAPDRACVVYAQRAREAYPDVPIVIGGIEGRCAASPITTTGRTRCAAPCSWTPRPTCCCTATPSAPSSSGAPPGRGENIHDITDLRGTAFVRRDTPQAGSKWIRPRSTPGRVDAIVNPYVNTADTVRLRNRKGNTAAEGRRPN
jgi:hypothetical protein